MIFAWFKSLFRTSRAFGDATLRCDRVGWCEWDGIGVSHG